MTEMHALAAAVVTGQQIKVYTMDGKRKKKLVADVIQATLSCEHSTGSFYGSVNYHIVGEQYTTIQAFYNMWKDGWEPND